MAESYAKTMTNASNPTVVGVPTPVPNPSNGAQADTKRLPTRAAKDPAASVQRAQVMTGYSKTLPI